MESIRRSKIGGWLAPAILIFFVAAFPAAIAGAQYVSGAPIPVAALDPGVTVPPTTGGGTIDDATSLEDIQRADDYNQAEHEDVLRLYTAFFNRPPDVSGGKYWIADIYEGLGASLDAIAAEFALSQEFQNTYGVVDNDEYLQILYFNVLGRIPDPTGFDYWLGLLDDETLNRGSVVRWVAAGDEFEQRVQYPDLTP
jgi:hypothetical protein